MINTSPFIKSIHINKVRHLQNIFIPIDDVRPRNLIITGPNGCGKTSLLTFLKDYLEGIPNRQLLQIGTWKQDIVNLQKAVDSLQLKLSEDIIDEEKSALQGTIFQHQNSIRQYNFLISQFEAVKPDLYNLSELIEFYHSGKFIISFFDAKRFTQMQPVIGAQKLELSTVNPIAVNQMSLGSRFLVNQENRAALLQRKGDVVGVAEIQKWMEKITEKFRELFQNENLTLDYDIDNFDFTINMPGREPFRLVENQLSDGFSAVIKIIAELLLRMEGVTAGNYNLSGIVLIDEIETHLHIKLQKTILPFLTDFFPNIQFIVTTHSPFVITSLNDAVVFDLDSKECWQHMATMSASTAVENYFELDLYSEEIKQMVLKFSELVDKKERRTDAENEEIKNIQDLLDHIDYERAPELVAQYNYLRTKESVQ